MIAFLPTAIVVVLLLLNALFVAAEFAIVGVSRIEIERVARKGSGAARLIRWIIADPRRQDRFIATAQLGITAASLGLGMYGEHALADWLAGHMEWWGWERWVAAHTIASVVAVTVLTYFHIVVGEMVPKSLALQSPGRTALWIGPIMRVVQLALYPLVFVFNGLGNAVLGLVGVRRELRSQEHYRTPEEIAYIVRESLAGGVMRKASAQVVGDLIEFGDRTAAEVMVPRVRVAALPTGAGRDALAELLKSSPHTRYPVYEGTLDRIVGMLHVRDGLRSIRDGRPIGPEYLRPVPHLPATARTDQLLVAMRQAGVQMAIVMDEYGGTAGIVTLEDLFEEVVGEITERASDVPQIAPEGKGVRVDGAVRIEEVGDALGVVLEHEEVDTVSGLVLALLGRRPIVGDVVEYDGVRFEVQALRGNGVGRCVASLAKGTWTTKGKVTE
jgi:CBS domain containing-hemolysin-like protein